MGQGFMVQRQEYRVSELRFRFCGLRFRGWR